MFVLTPPQFVLVKHVEGRPEVRLIGHPGFSKPWGPFINQQYGLHAAYGDSAHWDGCYTDEVMRTCITPDTSFAGLYAETSSVRTLLNPSLNSVLLSSDGEYVVANDHR